MDYLTVRQTADRWGVTPRQVQVYLKAGRIPNAIQPARDWLIPENASKPEDARKHNRRHLIPSEGSK